MHPRRLKTSLDKILKTVPKIFVSCSPREQLDAISMNKNAVY